MNRKGFTLIELLAVIIIMALVLVIAIPNSVAVYKRSKLKTEETFVKRISQVIDEYTSLNIDTLQFSYYTDASKPGEDDNVSVSISHIHVNDLISQKFIKKSDYINPNNKEENCNINAEIEIYKDSDFVYCHKIRALELECLTDDYIESIEENENYISNGNPYVVDTCVWE